MSHKLDLNEGEFYELFMAYMSFTRGYQGVGIRFPSLNKKIMNAVAPSEKLNYTPQMVADCAGDMIKSWSEDKSMDEYREAVRLACIQLNRMSNDARNESDPDFSQEHAAETIAEMIK